MMPRKAAAVAAAMAAMDSSDRGRGLVKCPPLSQQDERCLLWSYRDQKQVPGPPRASGVSSYLNKTYIIRKAYVCT